MAVDIETFGQLLPGQPRRRTLEIKAPATARDLAVQIGLDPSEIGLITIDGVQSDLDDEVPPGSRLCFFPYVSGG
ncbi:MAG: MoaD/ThiS family protein [Acidobacteria bacterium]|nr:MoaD/ThiS family protein [Acidobacteriota bacterium]